MKKIILLIAMVAMAAGASAQISWGVKAGLNGANLGSDLKADMKLSFYVGATAELPLGEKFAFQPELVYSRQGAKYSVEGAKTQFRLNYLNLPLLAKFYILDKWSVEAGPQLGYALNAKYAVKADGKKATQKMDSDVYNAFDFAVAVGTSYCITDHIGASVRYNIGVTNVAENSDIKMHNNVLQIGAFYKF